MTEWKKYWKYPWISHSSKARWRLDIVGTQELLEPETPGLTGQYLVSASLCVQLHSSLLLEVHDLHKAKQRPLTAPESYILELQLMRQVERTCSNPNLKITEHGLIGPEFKYLPRSPLELESWVLSTWIHVEGPMATMWLKLEDKQGKSEKTTVVGKKILWYLFYKATRDVQKPYLQMIDLSSFSYFKLSSNCSNYEGRKKLPVALKSN